MIDEIVLLKLVSVGLIYLIFWLPHLFTGSSFVYSRKIFPLGVVLSSLLCNYIFGLPAYSFFKATKSAYRNVTYVPERNDGADFFRAEIISSHNEYYKYYDFRAEKPNLILLFAEGTSELVLSESLTPNTLKFLNSSIRFSNYYNHTAATFRGIRGQMISGYQYVGGYYQNRKGVGQMDRSEIEENFRNRVESIPTILSKYDYDTIFCSPHSREEHLAEMLSATGFQKIQGAEDFGVIGRSLTDREQYKRLLQTIESQRDSKKPFFLSAYIHGTHHGMDSNDIKFADGENSYLNKFHNQDYWFGKFFNELESRGLLKNTIVIWTTDHATYPTPEFNQTFSVNKEYFVDKIPLAVYYEGVRPVIIDAGNRNSLSLAPTILDLLDIVREENHFLGRSMFSNDISPFEYISNIGDDFYLLESGVIEEKSKKEMPKKIIRSVNQYNGFCGVI